MPAAVGAPHIIAKTSIKYEMPDDALEKWTDDQEAALLRAVVQWKPVGLHKHFRMVAIHDYMVSQGVTKPDDEHTSVAGIWQKLDSLYDLPGLDEREDAIISDAVDEEGGSRNYWREFELPRDEFEGMMWDRRLAPEGTSSPAMSRRESTIADTDEPRSSPVSNRGAGRGARGGARKSGRLSRLQNELEDQDSKVTSKAGSVADEDHEMKDADDEDEGGGSADGDGEGNEDEQDDGDHKAGSKRGTKGAKSDASRGTRRSRRRG